MFLKKKARNLFKLPTPVIKSEKVNKFIERQNEILGITKQEEEQVEYAEETPVAPKKLVKKINVAPKTDEGAA